MVVQAGNGTGLACVVAMGPADTDAGTLALTDGDAAAQLVLASISVAPASVARSRWVVPPRSTTGAAYSCTLRPDYGPSRRRLTLGRYLLWRGLSTSSVRR